MSHSDPMSSSSTNHMEWLERLSRSTPVERRAAVLHLMSEAGGSGLPASPAEAETNAMTMALPSQPDLEEAPASLERRVDLRGAMLSKVDLAGIDLRGIDFAGACLEGSLLRGADLRGVCLEAADLSGADLVGARLDGAALGKANLGSATCEEASFVRASLRFVRAGRAVFEAADLRSADLWGADLREAVLVAADLRGAVLRDVELQDADLSHARLRDATIGPANFARATLIGADFRGASVANASFQRANLTDARLASVVLTGCSLECSSLAGASLEDTRIEVVQVGPAVGEELAGSFGAAGRAYLTLEKCFAANGDHAAASWAYRRRRRMQKRASWQRAGEARNNHQWQAAMKHYGAYFADAAAEWLCDYGESVPRVLAALLAVYLGFMVTYAATGSIVRVEDVAIGPQRVPTYRLTDAAIFSLMAMTTSGSPVVVLQPANEQVHILTGTQALLGIGLTGLLGFVLGNRIRR